MKLTVEISMYPFNADYIPPIKAYIEKLNSFGDLLVHTTPTCTIVEGDYAKVMAMLDQTIRWSVESYGKAVFVTKFLAGYQGLSKGAPEA